MKKRTTKKASKKREAKWPSKESLKEIPEATAANTIAFGRGPEARKKALAFMRASRGRPKQGETAEGTANKSLRLPLSAWKAVEHAAEKRGVSLHAAMREAVTEWLQRQAG